MRHADIIMRLSLALGLMAQATVSASAQTNPKAGYVVTLEGDTLRGTIDYRTDSRNSRTCQFRAEGAAAFTAYSPGEIRGYGLLDSGTLYVSRTFPVEGDKSTFFAESLLQGGVSVYHHREGSIDYYYLVDSVGRTATIREPHDLYVAGSERREAQRRKLAEAGQMLGRDPKVLKELWDAGEMTPEKLVRIMSGYNAQAYPGTPTGTRRSDGSDAASRLTVRPRLEAAAEFLWMTATPHDGRKDLSLSGTAPSVGIGLDIVSPRLSRSVVFQVMAFYSYDKATGDNDAIGIKKEAEVRFSDLGVRVGGMYRFMPDGRFTPVVRAGASLDYLLGYKTENMDGYFGNSEKDNHHTSASVGFYGGAGGEMSLGKQRLSLTANYVYRNFGHFSLKAPMLTVNAGLVF